MSEPGENPLQDIPEALVHPRHRFALPLIWILPLVAAVIGAWIAIHAILDRGPEIHIVFQNADGIEAGKTPLRYRSVDVGQVRSMTLTPDHRSVIVTAQMSRGTESLLASDSRFWVVRPRIATGGISGLGTLLSGSYIGLDIGHSDERSKEFQGLETPPVIASDVPGREFILHADSLGSLTDGSPLYFRHLPVGDVTHFELDPDGHGVTVAVFVQSPYDRFVTRDTRFWHASGIDVALDAGGLRLQTESIATIIAGGIAFETPTVSTQLPPAGARTEFRMADNRDAAMKSPDEQANRYVLYFKGSLRGLAVGSPVDLNGVEVGEVRSISIEYDPVHQDFKFPVEINVYAERIRARYLPGSARPDAEGMRSYRFVERLIEHGFRGQLRTASLLTGQQYVALDFFPSAPRVTSDPTKVPMLLPSIPGGLDELATTLSDIARKINAVPIERIGADTDRTLVQLKETLESANRLVTRFEHDVTPELAATISEARKAMATADHALAADSPLQENLQETLRQLAGAAESLRALADYLDQHPESLLRGKAKDDR